MQKPGAAVVVLHTAITRTPSDSHPDAMMVVVLLVFVPVVLPRRSPTAILAAVIEFGFEVDIITVSLELIRTTERGCASTIGVGAGNSDGLSLYGKVYWRVGVGIGDGG